MSKIKYLFILVIFASNYANAQSVVDDALRDASIEAEILDSELDSDFEDDIDKALESVEKKPEKVVEVKKPEKKLPPPPKVISKEELEVLNKLKAKSGKKSKKNSRNPVYVPAPSLSQKEQTNGNYILERDSSKIITKNIHTDDALTIKMCFSAGLNISYHHSVEGEFQTIILDDSLYFSAKDLENKRGAYVRLIKPVPEGKYWESALRLVTKDTDETLLINLIGVPCPTGIVPFPKVVYLKPKIGAIHQNSKLLTPEDTIIQVTKGLPRIQKNRIRLYDMVASSNSDWVIFGMEVQYLNNLSGKTAPKVVILDNFQVNKIKSKLHYLPLQSKKATELSKVSSVRFKLSMNLDKEYIINKRYVHLVFLDEKSGHHQYIRVDTLPYFLSLKNRGFRL